MNPHDILKRAYLANSREPHDGDPRCSFGNKVLIDAHAYLLGQMEAERGAVLAAIRWGYVA